MENKKKREAFMGRIKKEADRANLQRPSDGPLYAEPGEDQQLPEEALSKDARLMSEPSARVEPAEKKRQEEETLPIEGPVSGVEGAEVVVLENRIEEARSSATPEAKESMEAEKGTIIGKPFHRSQEKPSRKKATLSSMQGDLGANRWSAFKQALGRSKFQEAAGYLRPSKRKLLGLTALAVLVAAGVWGWQEGKVRSTLTNALKKDPNAVLDASAASMKDIRSYGYDGNVKLYYYGESGTGDGRTELSIKESGVVDRSQGRYSDTLTLSASTIADGRAKGMELRMSDASAGDRDNLRLDDISFSGLEDDAQTEALGVLLKGSSGRWYATDWKRERKLYAKFLEYLTLPGSAGEDSLYFLGSEKLDDLVFQDKLFTFVKDVGEAEVAGIKTERVVVEPDMRRMMELVRDMRKDKLDTEGADVASDAIWAELDKGAKGGSQLGDALGHVFSGVTIELYIGKDDKLIHRIRAAGKWDKNSLLNLSGKLKEIYGGQYALKAEDLDQMECGFELDLVISGFDTAVAELAPNGAMGLEELTDKLDAPVESVSADDTDNDGLGLLEENYYGTDPNKEDTDGDGYKDGSEVRNGYDPLLPGSARLDYGKLKYPNN